MKTPPFFLNLRRPAAWLLAGVLLSALPARSQAIAWQVDPCNVTDWLALSTDTPLLVAAPTPLTVGQPVESKVTGDEAQIYTFPLVAGQVAQVVVDQQGVDVVVTALAPDGQPLAEADNPNANKGLEIVWLPAATAGDYRVSVRPLEKSSSGTYQITLETVRAATPADARRLRAQQLMAEGEKLRGKLLPRASSAVERQVVVDKYAAAYAIWHELNDTREADLALLSLATTSPSAALVAARLPASTNKMTVYYSTGFEARALAMRAKLEPALAYLTAKLDVSPTISLAILNQADWLLPHPRMQIPYGTPHSVAGLVVLPATLDFDKQVVAALKSGLSAAQLQELEAGGGSIEQQTQAYFEDVAYHEMGHLYVAAYGIKTPTHWVSELLASYLAVAYLNEKQPARAKNMQRLSAAFLQGVRPEHSSLEDFERLYSGVSPMNYGWYQGQFALRAAAVYDTEKFGLLENMKAAFPYAPGPRLTPAETMQRVEQFSPGFTAWGQQLTPATAATK